MPDKNRFGIIAGHGYIITNATMQNPNNTNAL
jgi:hypothetical protein